MISMDDQATQKPAAQETDVWWGAYSGWTMLPSLLVCVALTGAIPGRVMDGRSLRPLALTPSRGQGRDLLIMTPQNRAVRTKRYIYNKYLNGQEELYDLQSDPYQLTSRHKDPAYASIKAQLQPKLEQLRDCAGTECSRGSN